MNQSPNGNSSPASTPSEEAALTVILKAKMQQQECLKAEDREQIAYRIAELIVASKNLYTKELPTLMQEQNSDSSFNLFNELAGLRMSLLNLRDLITDFDAAFLDAMTAERKASATGEFSTPGEGET